MKKKPNKPDTKLARQSTAKASNKNYVTWSVRGTNWVWKKRASAKHCTMELATLALEDVWSKKPELQDAIKEKYLGSGHETPILGMTIEVKHSGMDKKSKPKTICSITALANAGFYNESQELSELI
jgi:hypothetical protein